MPTARHSITTRISAVELTVVMPAAIITMHTAMPTPISAETIGMKAASSPRTAVSTMIATSTPSPSTTEM